MKNKLNIIKKDMEWILSIVKVAPELFSDGIELELEDVAKEVIKLLNEIKKEVE